jgi:hypothetical protein
MLTSIARNAGPLAVLAGLLGLVVYADQAQWGRTTVLAATGSVANDCDRPSACRTSQAALGKMFDRADGSGFDLGVPGALPTKSICMLSDGVGEAAAAGDAMIAQAYHGAVVEGFGDSLAAQDRSALAGIVMPDLPSEQ